MISNNTNSSSTASSMNTLLASALGSSPDSSGASTGVSPGQRTGQAAGQNSGQDSSQSKASREFDSHVREGGDESKPMTQSEAKKATARERPDAGATNEASSKEGSKNQGSKTQGSEKEVSKAGSEETKSAETSKETSKSQAEGSSQSGQKPVMNHILRQLVKQNPGAQPPALQFIQGSMPGNAIEELPQLMASSRFIADALMEQDLSAYMGEDVKPSSVLRELGFSPDVITQALALGVDGSGPAQRAQVLSALGADPKRVESSLNQLKGAIAIDGVAGYMQQTLALAKTSGKQPGIVEKLTGAEVDDTSGDLAAFKANTSLEVQAIMAQALASANNWGPRAMMRPGGSLFGSIDLGAGMSAISSSLSSIEIPAVNIGMSPEMASLSVEATSSESPDLASSPVQQDAIMSLAQLQSRLESEFGGNVRVTGIGAAAWGEQVDATVHMDVSLDSQASNESGKPVESMNGDTFAVDTVKTDTVTVDTVNTDTVTTDTAQKPVTASPDLGRQQDGASANPGDTGQNFQKPDDGERSRQFTRVERPGFDPSRVDPEIKADMKATEPAQVAQNEPQASSMVEGVRINPAMSNDIQPAVEVAESPGAGKTERVEVNARHASETVRKIQDAVMRTSVNNIGAMRLDLSSPETGNLEVAVRLDNDGQVDVRVMAGSGELRDMISRELPQLRSALGEQNLSLRDFEAREWAGQQDFRGFANGRGDQRGDARDNGRGVTGAAGVNSRGVPIKALNDQMGRQALRSFRVVDLSDRSLGGPGRIKVLA